METPSPAYYLWQPSLPDGIYDNPHFGELIPGRIIEVPRHLEYIVKGDPAFERSSAKKFEAQAPIHEAKADLLVDHAPDSEEE